LETFGDSGSTFVPNVGSIYGFDLKVDRIAAAAIDRYMSGLGFEKMDGYYWQSTQGSLHTESVVTLRVSRPDEWGNGGGVISYEGKPAVISTHDYLADFQKVKNSVREACSPLRSLPQSGEMEQVCSQLREIRDGLCVNGDLSSSDGVAGYVTTIETLNSFIKGGQYAKFTTQITGTLRNVIDAIYQVVNCLHSVVEADKAAIDDFLVALPKAMDALPKKLDDSWNTIKASDVLKIAGWAIEAATAVASGGTSLILKTLANVALDAMSTIVYSPESGEAKGTGIGYGIDAGSNAIKSIIVSQDNEKSLSGALNAAEKDLAAFVNSMIRVVSSNPKPYDFHPYYLQGRSAELSVTDLDAVRSVVDDAITPLAHELRTASSSLAGLRVGSAFSRSFKIGRGPHGVLAEFNELNTFAMSALNALADELDDIGHSVKRFVGDVERSEEASAANLNTVGRDIAPRLPTSYFTWVPGAQKK
jgi:hypothetical protein